MLQARRDPDFSQESVGSQRGREVGTEDLEGDGSLMLTVHGEVNDRHAASPQLTLDGVTVRERGGEPVEDVGHGAAEVHGVKTG